MTESVKDQINAIERARSAAIKHVENTVQPLARAAKRILDNHGVETKRFWFRGKKKEYSRDKLTIVQKGGKYSSKPIEIFYEDKMVMEFDSYFTWADKIDKKRIYLFFYRGGAWEQMIIDEYRRLAALTLQQNYYMTGEECDWFNHDDGACGKHEFGYPCPCEDFL